jgi:hypothetical protein
MAKRSYVAHIHMDPQSAREFLLNLKNPEFRERLSDDWRQVLHAASVDVSALPVPESIALPDPETLEDTIDRLIENADTLTGYSASPWGFLVAFVVYSGANP